MNSKAKKGVKSAEAAERSETPTGSTETAGAAKKKGAAKKESATTKKGAAKKKSATAKKGAAKKESATTKKGAAKKSVAESTRDEDIAPLDIEDDGVDEDVAALVASVAGEDGEEIISLDGDEGFVEVISLNDEDAGLPVTSLDEGDEGEVAVISIDDEGDDASAREQLIAETLALAAAEEGETGAESRYPPAEPAESGTREPDEESSDTVAVEEPVPNEGDPAAPTAEEPSVPLLTPAALLALSEMRHGDIGTLGAELILDLGEGTTPEERDRILSAALAQVEMQEAIYRVPTETGMADRGKGTIALLLMLMALFVSVRPPALVIPEPPAQLVEADQIYGTRVALLLQVQQIEAYRIREQRLPESLGEIAVVLPGVRFVKSNSRLYQLIAYTPEGVTVVYDSASPASDFERISRNWTTTRDTP
jgi:hypothetical protein